MKDFSRRDLLRGAFGAATVGVFGGLGRPLHAADLPADITGFTAVQLSRAIAARQVSCREVMAAYLDQIDRTNPVYNAVVARAGREDLMREAAAADRDLDKGLYRGWMHGMPQAPKDLSNVAGFVTTSGFRGFKGNVASSDALFVSRVRAAGAIFIGKTNTPEFGLGSQTYNDVYGVTRNAYDPALCAGGSSGGTAVALATRMLPVADGSDMMGSLRNPGAYNNVIGFRPTQGRVPHDDADLFFQQLGYEGPMGRNVEDTAALLATMSGHDPRMPLSLRDELNPPAASRRRAISSMRIAYMGDYDGYLPTEPGLLDLCEQALSPLRDAGAEIDAAMPDFAMAELWETWLIFRHWTLCGSIKPLYDDRDTRDYLKPEAIWEMEGGLELSGLDLTRAAKSRSSWYRAVLAMFDTYDFLIMPSAQVFPFDADVHWPESVGGRTMDTYHRWMEIAIGGTLAGCPVANVPAGFDDRGRPMGLQVFGRPGDDMGVLRFAEQFTYMSPHLDRSPTLEEPGS